MLIWELYHQNVQNARALLTVCKIKSTILLIFGCLIMNRNTKKGNLKCAER